MSRRNGRVVAAADPPPVCFVQTNAVVPARFAFFLVQLISFLAPIFLVIRQAGVTG